MRIDFEEDEDLDIREELDLVEEAIDNLTNRVRVCEVALAVLVFICVCFVAF